MEDGRDKERDVRKKMGAEESYLRDKLNTEVCE